MHFCPPSLVVIFSVPVWLLIARDWKISPKLKLERLPFSMRWRSARSFPEEYATEVESRGPEGQGNLHEPRKGFKLAAIEVPEKAGGVAGAFCSPFPGHRILDRLRLSTRSRRIRDVEIRPEHLLASCDLQRVPEAGAAPGMSGGGEVAEDGRGPGADPLAEGIPHPGAAREDRGGAAQEVPQGAARPPGDRKARE